MFSTNRENKKLHILKQIGLIMFMAVILAQTDSPFSVQSSLPFISMFYISSPPLLNSIYFEGPRCNICCQCRAVVVTCWYITGCCCWTWSTISVLSSFNDSCMCNSYAKKTLGCTPRFRPIAIRPSILMLLRWKVKENFCTSYV